MYILIFICFYKLILTLEKKEMFEKPTMRKTNICQLPFFF